MLSFFKKQKKQTCFPAKKLEKTLKIRYTVDTALDINTCSQTAEHKMWWERKKKKVEINIVRNSVHSKVIHTLM